MSDIVHLPPRRPRPPEGPPKPARYVLILDDVFYGNCSGAEMLGMMRAALDELEDELEGRT